MNNRTSGDLVFVRLDEGEEVISSLKQVAVDKGLDAAVILSFVGALRHSRVILRKGVEKDLDHHVEAVGNGNITLLDSEPFVHLHLAIGSDAGAWVGHLVNGIVDVFCEVALLRVDCPIKRRYCKELAEAGITVPFRLELG